MPNATATIIGNLTADPVLRFTQGNKPVASFTVAVNEGKDRPASFIDVTAWDTLGDNIASSLSKGQRVVVYGYVRQQTWETAEGKRSKIEIVADAVGPDLRWAVATPHPVTQSNAQMETPQSEANRAGLQTARAALQGHFPDAQELPASYKGGEPF